MLLRLFAAVGLGLLVTGVVSLLGLLVWLGSAALVVLLELLGGFAILLFFALLLGIIAASTKFVWDTRNYPRNPSSK